MTDPPIPYLPSRKMQAALPRFSVSCGLSMVVILAITALLGLAILLMGIKRAQADSKPESA